jgi:hypothetical protein
MNSKLFRSLAAGVLFVGLTTGVRAAIPAAEQLLPADTLAFFTVPDYAAFRTSNAQTPLAQFWNDPAMKPFHDHFLAKWNDTFTAPLEKDLGLKVADFLALPQGQLTLAVTVNGSNGHDDIPAGVLVLLDARGKSAELKTNLAVLVKKWTDAGRKLRTEKIHGLDFTVVPVDKNDFPAFLSKSANSAADADAGKDEKPREIYFTQFESLLVAGNAPGAVAAAAAHLTGGNAPVIADDAVFAGDKLAQFRDQPVGYGWFNGAKFLSLVTAGDTTAKADATPALIPKLDASKVVGALGFGGLKSVAVALREQPDGNLLTARVTAPAATRNGLLKIVSPLPKDAGIPPFVPADVVKFSRFRIDGKQAWADLQKMVTGISPTALIGLNSVIETANAMARDKNPGFDLRTALFGNLGDDIMYYTLPPADDTLVKLASPPSLYLIAVANPDQVVTSIKAVAAITSPQDVAPAPRDFRGHKIYTLVAAARQTPDGKTVPGANTYVSTANGYLAISQDAGVLEGFLRNADGQGKALADTAGLTELAARAGGTGGGVFSYENQRETARSAFKLLKLTSDRSITFTMLPPNFRDWADFSLLPDYADVQKYFYRSVTTARADADGLTLKVFTQRAPQ